MRRKKYDKAWQEGYQHGYNDRPRRSPVDWLERAAYDRGYEHGKKELDRICKAAAEYIKSIQ